MGFEDHVHSAGDAAIEPHGGFIIDIRELQRALEDLSLLNDDPHLHHVGHGVIGKGA